MDESMKKIKSKVQSRHCVVKTLKASETFAVTVKREPASGFYDCNNIRNSAVSPTVGTEDVISSQPFQTPGKKLSKRLERLLRKLKHNKANHSRIGKDINRIRMTSHGYPNSSSSRPAEYYSESDMHPTGTQSNLGRNSRFVHYRNAHQNADSCIPTLTRHTSTNDRSVHFEVDRRSSVLSGSCSAPPSNLRNHNFTAFNTPGSHGRGNCSNGVGSTMKTMPNLSCPGEGPSLCSGRLTSEQESYVALDCEFVGVGPGKLSAFGRCSIVDYNGSVLCDIYAKPKEVITDYRTRWSGIRRGHMRNALPLEQALRKVKQIIKDKVVIGHALHNDFKVLDIRHPPHLIRDTSTSALLKQMAGLGRQGCSLKRLTATLLHRNIQQGEHCSVVDARATMELFKLVEDRWVSAKPGRVLSSDHWPEEHQRDEPSTPRFLEDRYWPDDLGTGHA